MIEAKHDFKSFIRYFILTVLSIPCIIAAALLSILGELPPPRISTNISIDYKARWLRNKLSDSRCDVLVLGSSMALNNFSSKAFTERFSAEVVNLGFWGATIADDYQALSVVINKCAPKLIILPMYHDDFAAGRQKVDWEDFSKVVMDDGYALTYLRTIDPIHILDESMLSYDRRRKGNLIYESLEFDDTGTVNLSASGFNIVRGRWEGYKQMPVSPPSQLNMESLHRIMELARQKGAQVLAATIPVRAAAAEFLDAAALENLWNSVDQIVVAGGGQFVRVDSGPRFPDELYCDFAHLNERGAAVWTRTIMDRSEGKIALLSGLRHKQAAPAVQLRMIRQLELRRSYPRPASMPASD